MKSEWRAAILSDHPSIGVVTEMLHPELTGQVNDMLGGSEISCFMPESNATGARIADCASMLSSGPLYVIGSRGRLLGCAAVSITEHPVYIYNVCIEHASRGRGLGERMLTRIVEDHPESELKVWKGGSTAKRLISFYQSHGFRIVSEEADHITMRRRATVDSLLLAAASSNA